MALVIRHADPERDAAGCAEVYAPYVLGSAISFEAEPPGAREMASRIEQIAATHAWLVAEVDGRVAGFAYGAPHRARAAYRWDTEVSAYVGASHHRQGLGRALYQELFELLRHQGMYVALAGIALPNEASIGLHESLGFELIGVYRNIGWKAGAWHDCGWWQLVLREPTDEPPPERTEPARQQPPQTRPRPKPGREPDPQTQS